MWGPEFDGPISRARQQLLLGWQLSQTPHRVRVPHQRHAEHVRLEQVVRIDVRVGHVPTVDHAVHAAGVTVLTGAGNCQTQYRTGVTSK